jgi:hypothetical protein
MIPTQQFFSNIEQLLESMADSHEALEIEYKGRTFVLSVKPCSDKLSNLKPHPGCLTGTPEDIVHMDWSGEWKSDLS